MQIIRSLTNRTNLFSLIFARSKFRKFRVLEKVAKSIAREKHEKKKRAQKLNTLSENKTWILKVPMHGLVVARNCLISVPENMVLYSTALQS